MEPITTAAAGLYLLDKFFGGQLDRLADRSFCAAGRKLNTALPGLVTELREPRNHDLARAVRRAQLRALKFVVEAYQTLPHPSWRDSPGYSAEDITHPATGWITQSLLSEDEAKPDPITLQRTETAEWEARKHLIEAQIERVFTHPEPHEGAALARQVALRTVAEDWTLDELKARLAPESAADFASTFKDWRRFEDLFRGQCPERRDFAGWWPLFRKHMAEEIKDNPDVQAIVAQQGISRILELLLDLPEEIDRRIGRRFGDWFGIVPDTGARPFDANAAQFRNRPTEMLIARYGVIPFLDHDGRLSDLLGWARGEARGPAGRLYVAPGGFGKTRLAIEAIRTLGPSWRATFLSPRNTQRMASGALARLLDDPDAEGVFLVLDYAESQIGLLKEVAAAAAGSKRRVRIMAIARSTEGWWQGVLAEHAIGDVFDRRANADLGTELPVAMRQKLFAAARDGFRRALSASGISPSTSPALGFDLEAKEFGSSLAVAMAAYLDVNGVGPSERSLLSLLADEEKKHWKRAIANGTTIEIRDNDWRLSALRRLMAQVTLVQGATLEGAATLQAADAETAKFSQSERLSIQSSASSLYGAALNSLDGDRVAEIPFLRAIEPDILGEHISVQALIDQKALLGATLAAVLSGPPFFPGDGGSILRVLERATHQRHDASIRQGAASALSGAEPMVDRLSADQVRMLEAQLPDFSTPLIRISCIVARKVVETASTEDEVARALNNYANRLSETGDARAALEPARRAVEIREALARDEPARFRPDLAGSLNNYANFLSGTSDAQAALEPARRAVDIYENLARDEPARFRPDLAMSLNNYANFLSETGDARAALEPARHAVDIYESLARDEPAPFRPDLARGCGNLGKVHFADGDPAAAAEGFANGVTAIREHAAESPAAFDGLLRALVRGLVVSMQAMNAPEIEILNRLETLGVDLSAMAGLDPGAPG